MSASIVGIKFSSERDSTFVSLEFGYVTVFLGFCYMMFLLTQYLYKTYQEHQRRAVAARIAANKPAFDINEFLKNLHMASGDFKDIFGMMSGAGAVPPPPAKKANPFEALFGEGGLDAILKGVDEGLKEKPAGKKPVACEKKEEDPTQKLEEKPKVEKKEVEPIKKVEPLQKPEEKPKVEKKEKGTGNVVVNNKVEVMPHSDLASESDNSTED